ncbi:hypothetical protein C2G38_2026978 [Gigaspora rosea]|uniref:Protein kinase domain-containing protein n=1 Tax=Gigaspora rosea TaxID=44941 RepID=A0A397W7J1_9GLOM|nr:hypothetical protein C2G38_2026978 [Gigaspora rosea]
MCRLDTNIGSKKQVAHAPEGDVLMPYAAPEVYQASSRVHKKQIFMVNINKGLRPEFAPGTPKCYIESARKCMDSDPQKRPAEDVNRKFEEWNRIMESLDNENEIKKQFLDADKMAKVFEAIKNEIGKGGFATVYQATWAWSEDWQHYPVALKIFLIASFQKSENILQDNLYSAYIADLGLSDTKGDEITTGKRAFDGELFGEESQAKFAMKVTTKGKRPEIAPGTPYCYIKLAEHCTDADPRRNDLLQNLLLHNLPFGLKNLSIQMIIIK